MSSSCLKVAFDTVGSQRTGIGHLLRSIALAEQLRAMNANVNLLSKPKAFSPLVASAIRAAGLDAAPLENMPPDVVVVDRPDTTRARLRGLHRRWPAAILVALDYYGVNADEINLVINLNKARERWREKSIGEYRCGLSYAILRAPFIHARKMRRRVPVHVRRILVGFGGTDPDDWSEQAIRAIEQCMPDNVAIDLLLGGKRPNDAKKVFSGRRSIARHIALGNPAQLLFESDLTIIGGGTMLMEAACLGVPAIVVPRTNEERLFARQFVRAGAARLVQAELGFPVKAIQRHVLGLYNAADTRRDMQLAGRGLVDGRGAQRVAKLIVQASEK